MTNNPQDVPGFIRPRRALFSLSVKSPEYLRLARSLWACNCELVASGGTGDWLESNGFKVVRVETLTGLPEMLDGRVKTLHPAIHAGILARRTSEHLAQLVEHEFRTFDVVVCTLYNFEDANARIEAVEEGLVDDENTAMLIESIDVGGVALLRGAAKNYESVCAITNADHTDHLQTLCKQLHDHGGTTLDFRSICSWEVFLHTGEYDTLIGRTLTSRHKIARAQRKHLVGTS